MKRNTLVLLIAIAMISCKKNEVKVIPKHESFAMVSPAPLMATVLESHIVSAEYITRYTQRIRYENNAVALITQNSIDTTKYNISITANFLKTSNLNASVTAANGIRTVRFYSGDITYFSFLANNINQVGDMYFNELAYPYKNTYPLNRLTYIGCMQKMIKSCGGSWSCSTVCTFGIVGCSFGWSLTCTALVINH